MHVDDEFSAAARLPILPRQHTGPAGRRKISRKF